jgi:hypothetical protein
VPSVTAETFLQHADDIIQITALTTFSVANGKVSPSPGFGSQSSGSNLINEIDRYLRKQFPDNANISINNDIIKIKAFDHSLVEAEERWDKLSRIFDGKKSLMRLCRYLSETLKIESIRPWEEMRGCLANIIASKKSIDRELIELIDSICLES